MTDPDFIRRAQSNLDATLAAEGITLGPDEMKAVREFHAEIAGLSPDDVRARLSDPNRQQGIA
jgi:hypothetical protein